MPRPASVIADCSSRTRRCCIAKGGNGGLGNLHFKSQHQPRAAAVHAAAGRASSRKLKLELRVLADVGLLGMPNAGKSTLIARGLGRAAEGRRLSVHDAASRTSASCASTPEQSFVVADIPGPDRRRGRRRRARPPVPAPPAAHAAAAAPRRHRAARRERRSGRAGARPSSRSCKKYDAALAAKPRWLVLNKIDLMPAEERAERVAAFVQAAALEGPGVRDLGADARRLRAADARDLRPRRRARRGAGRARPALRRGPTARRRRAADCSDDRRAARGPAHRRQGRLEPGHQRGPRPRPRRGRRLGRQIAALVRASSASWCWSRAARSPRA